MLYLITRNLFEMAQDSDVARMAAALKASGIRYKSFGNGPVRGLVQPAGNVANSFPLPGIATETTAAVPRPSCMPASDPPSEPQIATVSAPDTTRSVSVPDCRAYQSTNAPETAPPSYEPLSAGFTRTSPRFVAPSSSFTASQTNITPTPLMQEIGGATAGQFPFGALPAYPEPAVPRDGRGEFPGYGAADVPQGFPLQGSQRDAFTHAPTAHPQGATAYGFSAPVADPAQNSYHLLQSMGRHEELSGQRPQPSSLLSQGEVGTFGALSGPEASVAMQNFGQAVPQQTALHHPDCGQPSHGAAGFGPAALSTGNWPIPVPSSTLLPAAMVTLPLAEVMRLVAVCAPVVSSPFAAFRVSGGELNSR